MSEMRGLALAALALLAACGRSPELDFPLTPASPPRSSPVAIEPTLGPPPPQTLIVCLGSEPESLYRFSSEYLYGPSSREAETVLQAIYDGPIDVVGYAHQAVILENLPSLEGGDARLAEVNVRETEAYFNPQTFQPDSLAVGKPYLPAGCLTPAAFAPTAVVWWACSAWRLTSGCANESTGRMGSR